MKRIFVLLSLFLGLAAAASAQSLETLLRSLDQVIEGKEKYNREKEERINGIRSSLAGIKQEDRYGICDVLYREYAKYNLDSALYYAREKAAVATDRRSLEQSWMELADIYTNAGEYGQAEELLGWVTERSATYYHALHTLYSAMGATSVIEERSVEYATLKERYRDSLISNLPSNDVGLIFAM